MSDQLWYLDRTDLTGGQMVLAWVVGLTCGIGVAAIFLLAIF